MPSVFEPRTTLRGRVAFTTAIVAMIAALTVSTLSWLASYSWLQRDLDQRLGDALHTFGFELGAHDNSAATVSSIGALELSEVRGAGLRVAVIRSGVVLGGETLVVPTQPGCRTIGSDASTRQCTLAFRGDWLVAETSREPMLRALRVGALSALGAVALVVVLAFWFSQRTARVAVEPLATLQHTLETMDTERPSLDRVQVPLHCVEVDSVRASFHHVLMQWNHALEQARRFADNAAHELRTPLASARMQTELLAEEHPDIADVALSLNRTLVTLSQRLESVLILAHPRTPLQRMEPVSLDTVLREHCQSLDPSKRNRVECLTDDEGLIEGDSVMLQMLLGNAIENALKFSSQPVRVSIETDRQHVTLRIRDDGPGVSATERETIFTPYVRGAAGSQREGMGLGLALIAHIASIHRATARFEDVSHGACLSVTFPVWSATVRSV